MQIIERLASTATSVRRGLRQSRGTVVIAVLTLGAAIGTNVAVLGLVSRALLTPQDGLSDPDRLVSLAFERTLEDGRSIRQTTTSWPVFRQLAADVPAIATAAAWQRGPSGVLVGGEQPQVGIGQRRRGVVVPRPNMYVPPQVVPLLPHD